MKTPALLFVLLALAAGIACGQQTRIDPVYIHGHSGFNPEITIFSSNQDANVPFLTINNGTNTIFKIPQSGIIAAANGGTGGAGYSLKTNTLVYVASMSFLTNGSGVVTNVIATNATNVIIYLGK